ncbi:tetratricopeptide repeat protein, partial [Pseudomonas sp. CM25]|uniref:tetratricopeptide repeat protein n=1 Tax=Pseudomonas sp. CM25 TaxID=2738448 RepID=UPI001555A1E4|nr:tetratricopeptide repeat protein [Pseudomonas sp. CM25]
MAISFNTLASEYVGSDTCQNCHAEEYEHWRQSHHFSAIAEASDETVKGDFNNSRFTYNGITSRFYRKNGAFYVLTDKASGELEEFKVTHTFGTYPLQQYLIDFPDGRKQVLGIIWDTRPKEQGGQRWYHLFPDSPSMNHGEPAVTSTDPLHWTGIYFNWNSRCASCHSTNLEKGYQLSENRYDTRWSEISVGCEACHGPAKAHLDWVRQPQKSTSTHSGFGVSLLNPGIWKAVQDIAQGKQTAAMFKHSGPRADVQMQQCASCHSRRVEIGQPDPRVSYYDTHQLSLLEPPLYHADGQVSDEVFEWGSFLQSKMYREGVACTNCHDPHSGQLKAEGNALCTQCHNAAVFDKPEHHHHQPASAGSQCVNCHMPSTTFMGVDERRDHSLRIPRPQQSSDVGAPNACNQCHTKQDPAWAQAHIEDWLKATDRQLPEHPFAKVFHAADSSRVDIGPQLLRIAQDESLPAIVRGSSILRHAPFHNQQSVQALSKLLSNPEPLIRLGALRSMNTLPLQLRYQLLAPHLNEQVVSLRVEMARLLAGLDITQLQARQQAQLESLFNDFIQATAFNEDMPESLISSGQFQIDRKDYDAAETALKQAVTVAPRHEGALLNLADFYRRTSRDAEAAPLLERAVAAAPNSAEAHYAIGLLQVRRKAYAAAEKALRTATELAPAAPRYAYTYALSLDRSNRTSEAVKFLQKWNKSYPPDPQVNQVLQGLLAKQNK